MKKILIVDDEQDICDILQYNLETEGYEVETATSAEEALQLPVHEFDLLLLDVMMGEMSGFQMARKLRGQAATAGIPIIFITALDDEDDIVKGLNIGADDYMTKPISMREMKARVNAILRRTQKAERDGSESLDSTVASSTPGISFETLTIDTQKKTAAIDGKDIALTRLEFEMLLHFLSNPGKVYSREQLIRDIWPGNTVVSGRTVDVNITHIRKKLGRYGTRLKTRFGFGYLFEA